MVVALVALSRALGGLGFCHIAFLQDVSRCFLRGLYVVVGTRCLFLCGVVLVLTLDLSFSSRILLEYEIL